MASARSSTDANLTNARAPGGDLILLENAGNPTKSDEFLEKRTTEPRNDNGSVTTSTNNNYSNPQRPSGGNSTDAHEFLDNRFSNEYNEEISSNINPRNSSDNHYSLGNNNANLNSGASNLANHNSEASNLGNNNSGVSNLSNENEDTCHTRIPTLDNAVFINSGEVPYLEKLKSSEAHDSNVPPSAGTSEPINSCKNCNNNSEIKLQNPDVSASRNDHTKNEESLGNSSAFGTDFRDVITSRSNSFDQLQNDESLGNSSAFGSGFSDMNSYSSKNELVSGDNSGAFDSVLDSGKDSKLEKPFKNSSVNREDANNSLMNDESLGSRNNPSSNDERLENSSAFGGPLALSDGNKDFDRNHHLDRLDSDGNSVNFRNHPGNNDFVSKIESLFDNSLRNGVDEHGWSDKNLGKSGSCESHAGLADEHEDFDSKEKAQLGQKLHDDGNEKYYAEDNFSTGASSSHAGNEAKDHREFDSSDLLFITSNKTDSEKLIGSVVSIDDINPKILNDTFPKSDTFMETTSKRKEDDDFTRFGQNSEPMRPKSELGEDVVNEKGFERTKDDAFARFGLDLHNKILQENDRKSDTSQNSDRRGPTIVLDSDAKPKHRERPKSATLDYRYLNKARNPEFLREFGKFLDARCHRENPTDLGKENCNLLQNLNLNQNEDLQNRNLNSFGQNVAALRNTNDLSDFLDKQNNHQIGNPRHNQHSNEANLDANEVNYSLHCKQNPFEIHNFDKRRPTTNPKQGNSAWEEEYSLDCQNHNEFTKHERNFSCTHDNSKPNNVHGSYSAFDSCNNEHSSLENPIMRNHPSLNRSQQQDFDHQKDFPHDASLAFLDNLEHSSTRNHNVHNQNPINHSLHVSRLNSFKGESSGDSKNTQMFQTDQNSKSLRGERKHTNGDQNRNFNSLKHGNRSEDLNLNQQRNKHPQINSYGNSKNIPFQDNRNRNKVEQNRAKVMVRSHSMSNPNLKLDAFLANRFGNENLARLRTGEVKEDVLIDVDGGFENETEAMHVLFKLDEVLNECLKDGNDISGFSDDFVSRNQDEYRLSRQIGLEELEGSEAREISIEECLQDLDEYLRACDDESICSLRIPDLVAERRLQSYCNLGYVNNELNKTESDTRRPLSSCGSRAGALTRNHAYRATIGAIKYGGGEERAMVLHQSTPGCVDNPSSDRTSAADGDEVIDWSWLNDVEVAERVADCPSSSVVVAESMATGDAKRPNWLRRSMRRLQPLPLPQDADNGNHAPPPSSSATIMDDTNFLNTSAAGSARPISAPSRLPSVQRSRSRDRTSQDPAGRARSSSASSRSRRPRSLSSSVSSVVSSVDSTPTCTPTPVQTYNTNTAEEANNNNNNTRRSCERPARSNDMPEAESPLGQWPHSLSSTLAYIGCTLGIFNISRFAILSVHFGANFIFQFLIITFFIGLPMFTLQLCLGQQLGAGVIDMWKISPMFQGVGVSLLFFQALTGIYSIIGVSWMFVYFRDSFVTKFERYRWAEPFIYYRNEIQPPINGSYKLTETVPDYLSGIVFQRHHLVSGNTYGTIKFQPAFNLAVVWMIVFVSLSKGLRSYGKVIYVFTLLPIFGTFVLCAKLLGMMPPELINNVFPETTWNEFFINPRSWLAACQEAFLTWGLLGAAVMQIASHNKNKHLLQRDSSLIAVITITILLLVAFLANTCVQILKVNGFSYQPDSFEKLSTYMFMRHKSDPLPPSLAATQVKYMVHNSFIVGDRINRPGFDGSTESGYQVLRFATELIPATFAILGTDQVSPFWTVLFYFILILFGIAQQLAIWHCVITGIMAIKAKVLKSWETTITFFSCACGFILGLPMTTEFGIYVVYFMDLVIGGVWWLILIILLQIIAVFMVRGRPYSGDTLVTVLFNSSNYKCLLSWAPALLSFTWNVVLPVVLMVWCIAFFKNGNFRELFIWHHGPSLEYWPLWARQIGALLQLLPVLAVPFIAVIQSYRYLNKGPSDILDRIQLLYRPPIGEHMDDLAIQEAAAAGMNNNTASPTTNIIAEDPPPKYTPPPSYTTATGARIAKMLRQSIRRSMRRIANVLGESSGARSRNNPTTSQTTENQPPPPDYNAVLVEMNQNQRDVAITVPDRNSTLQRELATISASSTGLTAADVACILRSSFRRSTVRTLRRNNTGADQSMSSLSAENLIDSAAPIGETSLVLGLTIDSDNKDGNNTSSVI